MRDRPWMVGVDPSRTLERHENALAEVVQTVFGDGLTPVPPADVDLRAFWNGIPGPVLVIRGEHSDLLLAQTLDMLKSSAPRMQVQARGYFVDNHFEYRAVGDCVNTASIEAEWMRAGLYGADVRALVKGIGQLCRNQVRRRQGPRGERPASRDGRRPGCGRPSRGRRSGCPGERSAGSCERGDRKTGAHRDPNPAANRRIPEADRGTRTPARGARPPAPCRPRRGARPRSRRSGRGRCSTRAAPRRPCRASPSRSRVGALPHTSRTVCSAHHASASCTGAGNISMWKWLKP